MISSSGLVDPLSAGKGKSGNFANEPWPALENFQKSIQIGKEMEMSNNAFSDCSDIKSYNLNDINNQY